MSTRAEILAETLARLEVERYAPLPPKPRRDDAPPPITPEQGARNLAELMAATDGPPDESPETYPGGWRRVRGVLKPVEKRTGINVERHKERRAG